MTPDRLSELFGPLHPLDKNPNWTDQAACKGMDPNLFLPERGDNNTANAAKAICKTCPIIDDCLDYALYHHCIGIWGGTSGKERRGMVSKHNRPKIVYKLSPPASDIEHGTYNGWAKERRRGIQPCEECVKAHRAYRNQQRKKANERNQKTTP